jgi:hypothetical protein
MKTNSAFLPLLFLALPGCSGSVQPAGDQLAMGAPDDGQPGAGDPGAPAWTSIQPCPADTSSDPIDVEAISIESGILTVDAGHGAGCETHTYALCYESEWAESDPVQIGLRLLHDGHDDACDAYLSVSLAFDLQPLEEEYERAYQSEGGRMSLSLMTQSVVHTFAGGGADDVPTWEEIDGIVDDLNSCETVEDCQGISTRPCQIAYVNASADTSEVVAMIDRRNTADSGSDPIGCDASCQCGVLTCEAGKCQTAAGDCETTPTDGLMVCL